MVIHIGEMQLPVQQYIQLFSLSPVNFAAVIPSPTFRIVDIDIALLHVVVADIQDQGLFEDLGFPVCGMNCTGIPYIYLGFAFCLFCCWTRYRLYQLPFCRWLNLGFRHNEWADDAFAFENKVRRD